MCTSDDPYYGASSILVHEFAHTLHQYGVWYANKDVFDDVSLTLHQYSDWYGNPNEPNTFLSKNHIDQSILYYC